MSIESQIRTLVYDMRHQKPLWPSTSSNASCGHGRSRGGGTCFDCLANELTDLIGGENAGKIIASINTAHHANLIIEDIIGEELQKEK